MPARDAFVAQKVSILIKSGTDDKAVVEMQYHANKRSNYHIISAYEMADTKAFLARANYREQRSKSKNAQLAKKVGGTVLFLINILERASIEMGKPNILRYPRPWRCLVVLHG